MILNFLNVLIYVFIAYFKTWKKCVSHKPNPCRQNVVTKQKVAEWEITKMEVDINLHFGYFSFSKRNLSIKEKCPQSYLSFSRRGSTGESFWGNNLGPDWPPLARGSKFHTITHPPGRFLPSPRQWKIMSL